MKKIAKLFKKQTHKTLRFFFHPTFIYLTVLGNSVLILVTLLVYHLEKWGPDAQIKTYFDSLWWGISTITTVGYGDLLPQTFWGRLLGFFLMYTGTVLFISFTGLFLSGLMKEEVEDELAPLQKEIKAEEIKQLKIENTLNEMSERLEKLEKLLEKSLEKK